MTILKNLTLAPVKLQGRSQKEAEAEAMALLKRVGLEGRAHAYPSQLSGGQKQRIAIVRALCMKPVSYTHLGAAISGLCAAIFVVFLLWGGRALPWTAPVHRERGASRGKRRR